MNFNNNRGPTKTDISLSKCELLCLCPDSSLRNSGPGIKPTTEDSTPCAKIIMLNSTLCRCLTTVDVHGLLCMSFLFISFVGENKQTPASSPTFNPGWHSHGKWYGMCHGHDPLFFQVSQHSLTYQFTVNLPLIFNFWIFFFFFYIFSLVWQKF